MTVAPVVPATLYDLSARIDAALAVVRCIPESLPCGERIRPMFDEINHVGNLAGAVQTCLEQAARDVQTLQDAIEHGEAMVAVP